MLRSTVVVIGLPALMGAAFVYNLKSDEVFRIHFEDKYPDLISKIQQYVNLEADMLEQDAAIADETQRRRRPFSEIAVCCLPESCILMFFCYKI